LNFFITAYLETSVLDHTAKLIYGAALAYINIKILP